MDNFTDAAGEIMWDEEEKKAREDNKEEHQKKAQELERYKVTGTDHLLVFRVVNG
jgi:hypothetical protein